MNEAKGPAGLGEVRKAYEYSADRIGQGAGAGPLWAEYLAFLQARTARSTAADHLSQPSLACNGARSTSTPMLEHWPRVRRGPQRRVCAEVPDN